MIPPIAQEVIAPHSEVCLHMKVAGQRMYAEPIGNGMAQLWTVDGSKFSSPVTCGEAGIPHLATMTPAQCERAAILAANFRASSADLRSGGFSLPDGWVGIVLMPSGFTAGIAPDGIASS